MRRSSSIAGSSGRQSMMALRVQDNNKMGLQTPQMKDRGTFGKLSMSKPTPGTSERKVSFFGKRTSGAGGSRNSQYGVFGTEKIKDPRPLHDKAFIQQCIKQLCEFLVENGYAHNVSMKSLQSPSVKDFLKIFTFIYGFLCPSYELPDSKFEEEIPRVFKELGFEPMVVSKRQGSLDVAVASLDCNMIISMEENHIVYAFVENTNLHADKGVTESEKFPKSIQKAAVESFTTVEHGKTWKMQNAMMPVTKQAQEGRPFPKEATTEEVLSRLPSGQEGSLVAPLILYLLQ